MAASLWNGDRYGTPVKIEMATITSLLIVLFFYWQGMRFACPSIFNNLFDAVQHGCTSNFLWQQFQRYRKLWAEIEQSTSSSLSALQVNDFSSDYFAQGHFDKRVIESCAERRMLLAASLQGFRCHRLHSRLKPLWWVMLCTKQDKTNLRYQGCSEVLLLFNGTTSEHK